MGIAEYVARELSRQAHRGSQEFYEFVMPAVDMHEDGNDLVIEVDLPGFAKKDINLRIIDSNILSIKASRKRAPTEEPLGPIYYRHRPVQIDKRIMLPISTNEGEKVVGTAKYADGVVTLRIPIPKTTVVPIT